MTSADDVYLRLGTMAARQETFERTVVDMRREGREDMAKIWNRLDEVTEALSEIRQYAAGMAEVAKRLDRLEREHAKRQCHYEPTTDQAKYRKALDQSVGSLLAEILISALKLVGVGVVISVVVLGAARWNGG